MRIIARAFAGGEGGIRTLGTLIRGTHDFQSCTFNRSVTSPASKSKYLAPLPFSPRRDLSKMSIEYFETGFLVVLLNYHSKISVAKCKAGFRKMRDRCTIESRESKKFVHIHGKLQSMSP